MPAPAARRGARPARRGGARVVASSETAARLDRVGRYSNVGSMVAARGRRWPKAWTKRRSVSVLAFRRRSGPFNARIPSRRASGERRWSRGIGRGRMTSAARSGGRRRVRALPTGGGRVCASWTGAGRAETSGSDVCPEGNASISQSQTASEPPRTSGCEGRAIAGFGVSDFRGAAVFSARISSGRGPRPGEFTGIGRWYEVRTIECPTSSARVSGRCSA